MKLKWNHDVKKYSRVLVWTRRVGEENRDSVEKEGEVGWKRGSASQTSVFHPANSNQSCPEERQHRGETRRTSQQ